MAVMRNRSDAMDHGNWEIGLSGESLDDLLNSETTGMTLWFLAGYLKGLSDGGAVQAGEREMLLEPDGDQGWRVRYSAMASEPEAEGESL